MVVCISSATAVADDSTFVGNRRMQFDGSGSFLSLSNWKGSTFRSYSLSASADYFSLKEKNQRQVLLAGRSQTAFTRYIDSVWVKSSDRLDLQLIFSQRASRLSKTWSMLLHTGLLTGFEYVTNGSEGKMRKKMNSTFLMPADFEAGYGMGLQLNATSYLNFTFATLRFRIEQGEPFDDDKPIFTLRNGFATADYGFGVQWYYFKSPYPGIETLAEGKIFMNGFSAFRLQSDVHLKATFRIWKHLHIKWELMSVYDPYISGKMQWRNEWLTGVVVNFNQPHPFRK